MGAKLFFLETIIFDIECVNSKFGELNIENSKILEFLTLEKSEIANIRIIESSIYEFEIKNTAINLIQIFESNDFQKITIDKSLAYSLNIEKSSPINNLSITNSLSNKVSLINETEIVNLSISNCFLTDLLFEGFKNQSCLIESSRTILSLKRTTSLDFQLTNCFINNLSFGKGNNVRLQTYDCGIFLLELKHTNLEKNSEIIFSEVHMHTCIMNNLEVFGKLYFKKITQDFYKKYLEPEELSNDGFSYIHLKSAFLIKELLKKYVKEYYKKWDSLKDKVDSSQPTFQIVSSSLYKTEFTECDLQDFIFRYSNSRIEDAYISGGTLPFDVFIYDPNNQLNSLNVWKEKRKLFKKFKQIFDRQQDVERWSVYKAEEANAQFFILSIRNKFFTQDWWVFFLNKFSNYYGQSWVRAIIFILITNSVLFTLHLMSNSTISLDTANSTWDWSLLGQLFTFISPVHSFNFLSEQGYPVTSSLFSSFFDFLARILTGYGIYQFISAFRKHGKRA